MSTTAFPHANLLIMKVSLQGEVEILVVIGKRVLQTNKSAWKAAVVLWVKRRQAWFVFHLFSALTVRMFCRLSIFPAGCLPKAVAAWISLPSPAPAAPAVWQSLSAFSSIPCLPHSRGPLEAYAHFLLWSLRFSSFRLKPALRLSPDRPIQF